MDLDWDVRSAATTASAYAALLPFVSEKERSLLLEGVLHGLMDLDSNVRCTAIQACPTLLPFVSEKERSLVLKGVLIGLRDPGWFVHHTAIEACAALLPFVSAEEKKLLVQGVLDGLTYSDPRDAEISAAEIVPHLNRAECDEFFKVLDIDESSELMNLQRMILERRREKHEHGFFSRSPQKESGSAEDKSSLQSPDL